MPGDPGDPGADGRPGGAVDLLDREPVGAHPVDTSGVARPGRWRSGWRRRLLTGAVVAVVIAVLAGAGWLVFVSRVLDTRTVRVEGTSALSRDRVLAAAAVPTGGPVMRVDTRAVAGRVLALPGVADVEVSRRLPHTVDVRVTERVPVAVLTATGGEQRLVDAGAAVWVPPGRVPAGLPVLLDRDGSLDATDVATAVQVSTALPAALRSRLRGLVVPSSGDVVLVLADDRAVVWGGDGDGARKVRVATALLRATRAGYVDVSVPDAPVTRPTVPAGLVPAR